MKRVAATCTVEDKIRSARKSLTTSPNNGGFNESWACWTTETEMTLRNGKETSLAARHAASTRPSTFTARTYPCKREGTFFWLSKISHNCLFVCFLYSVKKKMYFLSPLKQEQQVFLGGRQVGENLRGLMTGKTKTFDCAWPYPLFLVLNRPQTFCWNIYISNPLARSLSGKPSLIFFQHSSDSLKCCRAYKKHLLRTVLWYKQL